VYVLLALAGAIPVVLVAAYVARAADRRIPLRDEDPSARPKRRSSFDDAQLEPLRGWGRVAGFIVVVAFIAGFAYAMASGDFHPLG
jgi:hypothetical protein